MVLINTLLAALLIAAVVMAFIWGVLRLALGRWDCHVPTDPACRLHRPPVTRWGRWRFDRARGKGCPVCVPRRGWVLAWM
jgi:hypothetical protein